MQKQGIERQKSFMFLGPDHLELTILKIKGKFSLIIKIIYAFILYEIQS